MAKSGAAGLWDETLTHDYWERRKRQEQVVAEEVEKLIEDNWDLKALCQKLGYSPSLHRKSEGITEELKALTTEDGELSDKTRFGEVLDELERLYTGSDGEASEEDRKEVLEDVSRVRERILKDPQPYFDAHNDPLVNLPVFENSGVNVFRLLLETLCARYRYGPADPQFRRCILSETRRYLDQPFMHVPFLTKHLLNDLFSAEFYPHVGAAGFLKRRQLVVFGVVLALGVVWHFRLYWVAGILTLPALVIAEFIWEAFKGYRAMGKLAPIREEVESEFYDGEEIVWRLRQLEGKGVHLSSLLSPLLRLRDTERAPKH